MNGCKIEWLSAASLWKLALARALGFITRFLDAFSNLLRTASQSLSETTISF